MRRRAELSSRARPNSPDATGCSHVGAVAAWTAWTFLDFVIPIPYSPPGKPHQAANIANAAHLFEVVVGVGRLHRRQCLRAEILHHDVALRSESSREGYCLCYFEDVAHRIIPWASLLGSLEGPNEGTGPGPASGPPRTRDELAAHALHG